MADETGVPAPKGGGILKSKQVAIRMTPAEKADFEAYVRDFFGPEANTAEISRRMLRWAKERIEKPEELYAKPKLKPPPKMSHGANRRPASRGSRARAG